MRLAADFFLRKDVVTIARELIGKSIFTIKEGQICGGIITETEAYNGIGDHASHAFGGRRTKRNEMMYAQGGVIYVYLCYGIHHLLNIVTNRKDIPDAILIRSIFPTHGEELMLKRLNKNRMTAEMTCGPGKVSKSLGITIEDNGISTESDTLWIEDRNMTLLQEHIQITPRIGVDYAGADAALPYRFVLPTQYIETNH